MSHQPAESLIGKFLMTLTLAHILYTFLVEASRTVLIITVLIFLEGESLRAQTATEPTKDHRVAAETILAEAEQLRRQGNEESLRAAMEKYKQAQRYWRADNNKHHEALALEKMAEIQGLLSETNDALSNYEQALKLARAARDTWLQVATLNNLCSLEVFQGDAHRALRHCNRALQLSRQTGDRRQEAQALNNTGEAHYYTDMKQARAFFEQALTLSKTVQEQRVQAQALMNLGYIYTDWSDPQRASTYYREALTLWQATGDLLGEARTINALGVLHSKSGEKQTALNEHTKARQMFKTIGNKAGELTSLTGIGYVFDSMDQKQKALNHYVEALNISRAVGQPEAEMVLLIHAGNMYHALKRTNEAMGSYEEALSLSRVLADVRMQAYSLNFMGEIHESAGDLNQALSYYERALLLSRSSADKRGEALILNHIANVYERRERTTSALNHYRSALALQLATKDRQGEAWTRYNMARAYRTSGELVEARSQMDSALKLIESLRTGVGSHDLRVSYFASVQDFYSLYIDILMQMHKRSPSERLQAEAFEASGRARARNLLDLLVEERADIFQSINPALKERENTLRQTLNAKSERQMRLLGGKYSADEATDLAREISDLTFELEEVRVQIRQQSPRYAELSEPQPLSSQEVQQMLDDDTVLLEYALGEKRSYLWVVTKTEITTVELPERAKIEKSARRLYELLTARQFASGESVVEHEARVKEVDEQYWLAAGELGKMILEPVSSKLGTKRLLIIADGALLLLPFSALAVPASSNTEGPVPLMLDHEIVGLPSASALSILRRMSAQRSPANRSVMVLADPVFERNDPRVKHQVNETVAVTDPVSYEAAKDFSLIDTGSGIPRLLGSAEEADEIVRMAPSGSARKAVGFDANLDTVRDPEMAQYRIIHFATHGISNNEQPELSGIILSLYDEGAHPRAGFLSLHEIYNLDLPAELVVLSACNTGIGKEVKGEGLIGLTRAFMYAGAAGVMSSLWKVDDDATVELMKYFYEGVLKERLSPAAALRKAQIRMWQSKRWRSPYYWAAFVLHGEYHHASYVKQLPLIRARVVGTGVGVLIVSLFGFYLLRRMVTARK